MIILQGKIMSEDTMNVADEQEITVTDDSKATNTKSGKNVFALKSMRYVDGKEYQDGYLLFKNINGAIDITKTCAKTLELVKNPESNFRQYGAQFNAFYIPHGWITVNEFYFNNVNTKGSFYVPNIHNCCGGINQESCQELNENLKLSLFELNPSIPQDTDV